MALPNDITLNVDTTYSRTRTGASSGTFSDASAPVSSPQSFFVGHETAKNGRVSSVVQFDHAAIVDTSSTACCGELESDLVRVQVKLMYNPIKGRTDIDTKIVELRDDAVAFISDAANWAKLLNKEA